MTKDEALELLENKLEYFVTPYNEDLHNIKGSSAIIEALSDKMYDIKNLIEDIKLSDYIEIEGFLRVKIDRLL